MRGLCVLLTLFVDCTLPSIGSTGVTLDVSTENTAMSYGLALSAHSVSGKRFHETTVVVISPRYIVRNATQRTLIVRQDGDPCALTLLSSCTVPLHFANRLLSSRLVLSVVDGETSWLWSGVSATERTQLNKMVFVLRVLANVDFAH